MMAYMSYATRHNKKDGGMSRSIIETIICEFKSVAISLLLLPAFFQKYSCIFRGISEFIIVAYQIVLVTFMV